MMMGDNNSPAPKFICLDELEQIHKQILQNNSKKNTFMGLEEEPIKIDLKISDTDKVKSIVVETLGTYSFTSTHKKLVYIEPEKLS